MMHISKKQRAIINSAVKPFYITSNYLGAGLQNLLKYYSKYFAHRRFSIIHFLPTYKNTRNSHLLTVLFNALFKKGGFAKKRRPITWTFYGNTLLTKYGRKKQKKELKRKRKKAKRQKACLKRKIAADHQTETDKLILNVIESSSNDSNTVNSERNCDDEHQRTSLPAEQKDAVISTETPSETCLNETPSESNADKIDFGDDTVDNIWNLDIQEVAALITEGETDDNHLSENVNGDIEDSLNEESSSNENQHESQDEQIDCVTEETPSQSGIDINEKIRQQLKLLKMGKSENFLFTPKETRTSASTRSTNSSFRRTNSSLLDESKRTFSEISSKSPKESPCDTSERSSNTKTQHSNEEGQKSKSNGGIIDSLFNKFQSISSNISTRSKARPVNTTTPNAPIPMSAKRPRRDEPIESVYCSTMDSNHEDSNQSVNSVSMEFLGFDISNKNVDVSALLPTPKVVTSNEHAAFVSEYLDMFMKENSLEKANDCVSFAPKHRRADEALMTTDALPPNLSVPERPMDMQRPRTLAEKRMILQQHNDISILIIENESTVYHELKKRVKQGSAYDNSLMRSIQDADIPFTRDCWRAACWISTPNNRFFYRTILYDGEEIKLIGSRGDNSKKVAFKLNSDDKQLPTPQTPKHILAECPQKCLPVDGVRIHNMEAILGDFRDKADETSQNKQKFGLLSKQTKLCMFSREYLTPGPKSKKVNCKANRKSSFDLEYGPLELVQLPTVQLEVWPQVGFPLPDQIKPLLKTIPTNSNVITPERAKFAVSVVRETPKQIKHRRKYKKPESEKPQSIIFNIPYENNEKMILIRRRRRSAIVFNKSDTKHEQIETFYRDADDNQLTFAKQVDPDDSVSVECSTILANMIESVAIAVNDTNFIKQDPDIDYVGKIVPVENAKDLAKMAKTEKDKSSAKTEKPAKSKLMKELKRLNVTVIDTANEMVKTKKTDEICKKPFCKLGCVCESIDTAKHIQTHCELYSCMFKCSCINTPFSESKPFYFDNNIDMLQAQANARLAKVEKEFKSTIVVSENDMFVLPNSSTATKRSSKKPKRFTTDETEIEDTETEAIFKSKRRRPAEKVIEPQKIENRQRHNLLNSLQHVRVEMKQLPDLEVEPWCMVHCLYKCHCKGRAQKGRIFNFANKKNDMTGPGGWELITPRKRQYTFERENVGIDEPLNKTRKVNSISDKRESFEQQKIRSMQTSSSARTHVFQWKNRPRKTPFELRTFRNECMFIEDQRSDLLNQRIIRCRKYNQAQNMLTKSMENGRLAMSQAKFKSIPNGSLQSTNKPTNESLQRLNQVITETMHRLTALQERNQLTLNPTPNKLSIVPWDRMLQAFKSHEVFIWDVLLKDDLRLLVLTKTYTKPKSDNFVQITNINYADNNGLPMIAKMLRNDYQSERTKYMAMVLLRVTHFWRICGVLHSDLKYMDDELRARPTPDQNPLLGMKINRLYQLLTNSSARNARPNVENFEIKSIQETKNGSPVPDESASETLMSISSSNDEASASIGNDTTTVDDDDDVKEVKPMDTASFFENTSMRLSLPIPVLTSERLLMIKVGDDFTHVWFPTWHKFLSMKRIQNSFVLSKKLGKAIEMSQSNKYPKVFVSHLHDNCIFIGPYGNCDGQKLMLFVRHDNHMMLHNRYYEKFGQTFTKKSKASWIYPSATDTGKLFKIGTIYSKNNMPAEFDLDGKCQTKIETKPSTSGNELCQDSKNGLFTVSATNGLNAVVAKDKPSPSSSIEITPMEIDPEIRSNQSDESNIISNTDSRSSPFQLKISSVLSGESVALMTNGLPIAHDSDESNDMPQISDVQSLAVNSITEHDETNTDANNRNESESNDSDDELLEPKTEPIDISDDEETDYNNISDLNSISDDSIQQSQQSKGYIYCTTNVQLGKINIELTPTSFRLYLDQPIDVNCEEKYNCNRTQLYSVCKYLQNYMRNRFYGVYPAHLKLDWMFIDSTRCAQDAITLCDFNKLDPRSVVFRDKIVSLSSNYQDDCKIPIQDIYVLDIYQLASQLFTEEEIKSMDILEILSKCRKIDAELIEMQGKLKKTIANYQKKIQSYKSTILKHTTHQNGEV